MQGINHRNNLQAGLEAAELPMFISTSIAFRHSWHGAINIYHRVILSYYHIHHIMRSPCPIGRSSRRHVNEIEFNRSSVNSLFAVAERPDAGRSSPSAPL
jgi:hypothetical protein